MNPQIQHAVRPGVPAIIGTLIVLGMQALFGFQHLALPKPVAFDVPPIS